MTVFERSEFMTRIANTKKRMQQAGIDVLLISDPKNMYYLTGYSGHSFYTPQFCFVDLEAEEPVLAVRLMDVACATYTVFLKPQNVVGYPEEYVQVHDDGPNEMDFMADLVREKGWQKKRLGLEMNAYFFAPRDYERLKAKLPDATYVDASDLVAWVRLVKSNHEIQYMREAGKIAQLAMEAGIEAIGSGVRECDAAAAIVTAQVAGTREFGGDGPCAPAMPSGEKTAAPHLTWTDDPYDNGTAVNIELGGVRHLYASGLSRSVYVGEPPAQLADMAPIVADGIEAALDRVRPGNLCEDVEAGWRKVISRHGYEKASRIGYSIGIYFPPDWGERTASLRHGDKTELAVNMTFHMIVGMWMDAWGYVLSENFRVTEEGYELFSDMPRQLFVKD